MTAEGPERSDAELLLLRRLGALSSRLKREADCFMHNKVKVLDAETVESGHEMVDALEKCLDGVRKLFVPGLDREKQEQYYIGDDR